MWFIPIHPSGKSLEPTCQPRKIPVGWGGCGWGFMVQQVWGGEVGWLGNISLSYLGCEFQIIPKQIGWILRGWIYLSSIELWSSFWIIFTHSTISAISTTFFPYEKHRISMFPMWKSPTSTMVSKGWIIIHRKWNPKRRYLRLPEGRGWVFNDEKLGVFFAVSIHIV